MSETQSDGTPIQFGIFDWIEWDKLPANDIYEQRLKMLEYADRQDFFAYHLAEHHITPLSIAPSPGVFLSAAAQRTKRIRLGPLVYILPLYNPLRLLHEICMLDHLSQGRLELGVGRGISPIELERYHVNPEESRDMFHEALEILIMGFTNDMLNYEGKHYNYKDIRLWLHPYQKPYPPLWYASNNSETVPWMARQGLNTSTIFAPTAATRTYFDRYKQVWQEYRDAPHRLNHHIETPKLGLTRHLYIAPTDQEAVQGCREAFNAWFYNINYLWAEAGLDRLSPMRDFDTLLGQEVILAGSPQRVREQVKRAAEQSGINYFCPVFAFGNLSHQQVMRSMDLFVQEVMPAFR